MNIQNLINGRSLLPLSQAAMKYQRLHFRQIYNEQTFSQETYSFYFEEEEDMTVTN
jgi:hypothetical protein